MCFFLFVGSFTVVQTAAASHQIKHITTCQTTTAATAPTLKLTASSLPVYATSSERSSCRVLLRLNKIAIFMVKRAVRAAPVRSGVAVFRCQCGGCECRRSPGESYPTWCDEESPPGARGSWWGRRRVCTAKGRASAAGSSLTQELSPTFSGSCDQWQLTRPPLRFISLFAV